MKKIELKKHTEALESANGKTVDVKMSTLDLIKMAINDVPPGGFAASDMMERLELLSIVKDIQKLPEEQQPDHIELEDAQFKNLGKYVNSMKWSILSQFIVDFTELFKEK